MSLKIRGITPLLQVYDMPTAVRFYRDTLGFEILLNSPELSPGKFHWALLRLGGAHLMLNTAYEFDNERPTPPDPARTAAHGDTALYLGCPNLDAAWTLLKDQLPGLKPPHITGYGLKEMHLRDPDGYAICLQEPPAPANGTSR